MSGVTDNYGLITVEEGESYDEQIFNANNVAIDNELKIRATGIKSALKLFGITTDGTTFGTVPTINSDMKVVIGSGAFTADASGYIGVTMGVAFPNGYIVVSMANGDAAANPSVMFALATGVPTLPNTSSKFYVKYIASNTGTTQANGTARLNYVVVGW